MQMLNIKYKYKFKYKYKIQNTNTNHRKLPLCFTPDEAAMLSRATHRKPKLKGKEVPSGVELQNWCEQFPTSRLQGNLLRHFR